MGSAVLPLLWGAYQLLHHIGRQNLLHGGLRIQSTFNHPNDYGFYLVVVLVAAQAELREDRVDVLLDRPLTEVQRAGHGRVRAPLGDRGQLVFARL